MAWRETNHLYVSIVSLVIAVWLGLFTPLHALKMPHSQPQHNGTVAKRPPQSLNSRFSVKPQVALSNQYQARGGPRRIYFPALSALPGALEGRAREVMRRLDYTSTTSSELVLQSIRQSPGGRHVRFQQTSNGIPVWGGEAVVSFDQRDEPVAVMSDLKNPPNSLVQKPALPSSVAMSIARQIVGLEAAAYQEPRIELYYRYWGTWVLAQRVTFACANPAGDWEVWLDASSGQVIHWQDRTLHFAPPTPVMGQVFRFDPVLATGIRNLEDRADLDAAVPDNSYSQVPLRGLALAADGTYKLSGPYVHLEDWELPRGEPVTATSSGFQFTRSHPGFEDVMVYHHIDTMQRWFQSIGFTDANNHAQVVDAHGFQGRDNSKYVPSLRKLSFGEGGVDDAEDAAVIVHEYGHATQHDLVPTWGIGGHTLAMGEGFGDYLANSYAFSLYPDLVSQWNSIFNWDGHNEFWPGRVAVDPSLQYPRDADSNPHFSGTLWCSALTEALYAIGDRGVVDRLVLEHHYSLTGSATMEDAANAILIADITLYAGAHAPQLLAVFQRWGMLGDGDLAYSHMDHTPPQLATVEHGVPKLAVTVVPLRSHHGAPKVTLWSRLRGQRSWLPTSADRINESRYLVSLPYGASDPLEVEYYFEAIGDEGQATRLPEANQPPFVFSMARWVEQFEEPTAWTLGADDDATRGSWERVIPLETQAQPGADHTAEGRHCFVTGNGEPGEPPSVSDVDGGHTSLRSPVYDLSSYPEARLSYWRWFSNDSGSSPGEDYWQVQVSNDAGQTWSDLERTQVSEAEWSYREFDLRAVLGVLDQVQLRFHVSDLGAPSIVEAALDDVAIQVGIRRGVSTVPPRVERLGIYPNPFNPRTTVRLSLPGSSSAAVMIFDARGRQVRQLFSGTLTSGDHEFLWDGQDDRGQPLASGIYWIRLQSSFGTDQQKVAILR